MPRCPPPGSPWWTPGLRPRSCRATPATRCRATPCRWSVLQYSLQNCSVLQVPLLTGTCSEEGIMMVGTVCLLSLYWCGAGVPHPAGTGALVPAGRLRLVETPGRDRLPHPPGGRDRGGPVLYGCTPPYYCTVVQSPGCPAVRAVRPAVRPPGHGRAHQAGAQGGQALLLDNTHYTTIIYYSGA